MSNSGARDARVVILLMKSLEMDGLKVYVREILVEVLIVIEIYVWDF